jgi:alkylation response protein AidB-like acyl-CoA dehydrogenase
MMMDVADGIQTFGFIPPEMPPGTRRLREQVREFLQIELAALTPLDKARSWMGFDAAFSRKLGARGWIGMTWSKVYGGHERSALERYVVLEELLAAGAPVAAHWIADRQSGPLLLRFGTQAQRERFLPAIARGEHYFCIGFSEPAAGSDLAGVRTRARRVDGGWRLNGTKLWTTLADRAHTMIALVRTSGEADARHAGLSQLLIDLSSPGVTVRPIVDLVGESHFNEVVFEETFVPQDMLIGREGAGWHQSVAELSLERSGPERYLSSYQLLVELLAAAGHRPAEPLRSLIGELTAELWTLRQMSLAIAGQLALGKDPVVEAAIVKDLGASFEQRLPAAIQGILDEELQAANPALGAVMSYLLQSSPSFSLRGGTREILRGIIARGLGLR